MFATRRKGSLVGLDITTSSVKLIELSRWRGFRVRSYAAEPTPRTHHEKAIVDAARSVKRSAAPQARGNQLAKRRFNSGEEPSQSHSNDEDLSATDLEGQVELQADRTSRSRWKRSASIRSKRRQQRDPDMVVCYCRTAHRERRAASVGWRRPVAGSRRRRRALPSKRVTTDDTSNAGRRCRHFIAIVDFGAHDDRQRPQRPQSQLHA